ncbi:hypothetical protein LTR37_016601 [Vermiconidia calcicola]|uniref:Uncharacterized protein n=1 Tax=Vermiconidia calcicola TaxID=1690605 RepID=A0ACC3MNZ0_9PEZI|nr:hypothetical protein LTR37_016601 [Vermiconidia calcicola]
MSALSRYLPEHCERIRTSQHNNKSSMKAELLSGRQQSLIVSVGLEKGDDTDRGVPKQLSAPARAAALDEHVAGTPFADSEELAGAYARVIMKLTRKGQKTLVDELFASSDKSAKTKATGKKKSAEEMKKDRTPKAGNAAVEKELIDEVKDE